jgi:hypothetical protein
MILIRYLLIIIIGYLVARSFINFGREGNSTSSSQDGFKKNKVPSKKVSKEIGEYVDYEEIQKKK